MRETPTASPTRAMAPMPRRATRRGYITSSILRRGRRRAGTSRRKRARALSSRGTTRTSDSPSTPGARLMHWWRMSGRGSTIPRATLAGQSLVLKTVSARPSASAAAKTGDWNGGPCSRWSISLRAHSRVGPGSAHGCRSGPDASHQWRLAWPRQRRSMAERSSTATGSRKSRHSPHPVAIAPVSGRCPYTPIMTSVNPALRSPREARALTGFASMLGLAAGFRRTH